MKHLQYLVEGFKTIARGIKYLFDVLYPVVLISAAVWGGIFAIIFHPLTIALPALFVTAYFVGKNQ